MQHVAILGLFPGYAPGDACCHVLRFGRVRSTCKQQTAVGSGLYSTLKLGPEVIAFKLRAIENLVLIAQACPNHFMKEGETGSRGWGGGVGGGQPV